MARFLEMAHGEDLCEELAIAKGLEMAHGEDLCEELAIAKGSKISPCRGFGKSRHGEIFGHGSWRGPL